MTWEAVRVKVVWEGKVARRFSMEVKRDKVMIMKVEVKGPAVSVEVKEAAVV